jgi:uncharacterized protein (DUF302 family)
MQPFLIAETDKSFEVACTDLERAIVSHRFGLMGVHDLGESLRVKNISFIELCRVYEVCNPQQAAKVLGFDLSLNMVLPCRISVFTERGHTRIGMIRPVVMLGALSDRQELMTVAQEVEASLTTIIEAAAASSSLAVGGGCCEEV